MPVDILKPRTWVRYRPALCQNCMAGCCTLPLRIDAENLYHMGLIRYGEVMQNPLPIAKRLIKKGYIRSFNKRTKLFTVRRYKNNDCIFLDEDRRCKIYDRRPSICREFPKFSARPGYCPNQKKGNPQKVRSDGRSVEA